MATIKDIARLTNVSAATVSNVLNEKKGSASAEKIQEIFSVAKELKYTPNSLAKNLKRRKTNTIGIITEDLTVFNTPEIVDGIDEFCELHGYEMILDNMRLFKRYNNDFTDTPKHKKLLDTMVSSLLAKQVEGIVYIGYHCREITHLPVKIDIPLVYAYCYPSNNSYPSVMFNDEKAAYDVTSLLIGLGHSKIGVIAGPLDSIHTTERLRGFQKASFDNHLLYNIDGVFYGDWERKSGYDYADKLLEMGVSAIFTFNDLMASGVYERCLELGLVVGKDISLFGFDDREISHGYSPRISTVAPPLNEIGQKCAEIIINSITSKKLINTSFSLECAIKQRGSIGEFIAK